MRTCNDEMGRPIDGSPDPASAFNKLLPWIVCILVGCILVGCDSQKKQSAQSAETGPATIAVSNYALAYFAEEISKGMVDVYCYFGDLPENESPGLGTPSSSAVVKMQKASKLILNGADYEKWIGNVTLPDSKLVDSTESMQANLITELVGVAHKHGPDGVEHQHSETASMVWLNPDLALIQAEVVRNTLIKLEPDGEKNFNQGFKLVQIGLRHLKEKLIGELVQKLDNVQILATQNSYQYLGQALSADIIAADSSKIESIEIQLGRMIDSARTESKSIVVLLPSTPTTSMAEYLKRQQVAYSVFKLLETAPANGDFLDTMRENLKLLKNAVATAKLNANVTDESK